MRTKNVKRLWPVPATLAVVALAAFLAFGLLASNGPQTVLAIEGDHSEEGVDNHDAYGCHVHLSSDGTSVSLASGDNGVDADDTSGNGFQKSCSAASSDAAITFVGDSTNDITIYLYIEDEDGEVRLYRPGTTYGNLVSDFNGELADERRRYNEFLIGTKVVGDSPGRYSARTVEIDAAAADLNRPGQDDVHATETVTISGTNPSDVAVHVYGSSDGVVEAVQVDLDNGPEPGGEAVPEEDGETVQRLVQGAPVHLLTIDLDYLGAPVEPDPADAAKKGTMISPAMIDSNGDSVVTVQVQDMLGHALSGSVQLTVNDPDNKATIKDAGGNTAFDGITDGTAVFTVSGLPKKDAVKIPVTAVIQSSTGPLTLTKNVSRVGDVASITSITYRCAAMDSDGADIDNVDLCVAEAMKLATKSTSDDPSPATVFKPGETFLIRSTAMDSEMQAKKDATFSANEVRVSGAPRAVTITFKDVMMAVKDNPNTINLDDTVAGQIAYHRVDIIDGTEIGSYSIEVEDNGRDAETTVMLTVAGDPVAHQLTGPEWIAINGLASYTVAVTDENGNPAALLPKSEQTGSACIITVTVESSVPETVIRTTNLDDKGCLTIDPNTGMGEFKIVAPFGAQQGDLLRITAIRGDQAEILTAMLGDAPAPPTAPGMPMNVMAEATSDTMITVTWESPAADGGSDITGYVLQRKTGMMDFMTIAASSAEIWWNTLDCPMMNAEIPDDATPAPPADDTDMTSPYCAMYAGLSAEATTVVDGVFAAEYDTISGTSHSDMGLMAETTYYYRVSAMNSVDMGDYSDGTAMATTMMATTMMDELGTATGIGVGFNRGGALQVYWTKAANAMGYIIVAIDTADSTVDGDPVVLNDGDAETRNISGLTPGATYDIYVIATGSGGAFELGEPYRVTAQ